MLIKFLPNKTNKYVEKVLIWTLILNLSETAYF